MTYELLVISLCASYSFRPLFPSINYFTLDLLTPHCIMSPQSTFLCIRKHTFFTCGQWDVVNLKSLKLLYLSSAVILFSIHISVLVCMSPVGQTGRLIQKHSTAMLFITVIKRRPLLKVNTCPLKWIAKDITLNVNNNVQIRKWC